jgi:hypothetical protein
MGEHLGAHGSFHQSFFPLEKKILDETRQAKRKGLIPRWKFAHAVPLAAAV